MKYQLVSSELENGEIALGTGDNVILDDLPRDYKVYAQCYLGPRPSADLVAGLRDLGDITGNNLFINFAKPDDPRYADLAAKFNITVWPTIIITGIDELASPPGERSTAFVKMDALLRRSPDVVMNCLYTVFNLFVTNKISQAIGAQSRKARFEAFNRVVTSALEGVRGFVNSHEISVGFIDLKFSLRPVMGGRE